MAASQKLCRLNARLLEKRVKSVMRILIDPAFNNVIKSVPLCHSALDFFLKAKIITWTWEASSRPAWKKKKQSIFHRKRHKLKCLIGEEFLRISPGKEMLMVDEMQTLHDLIMNGSANKHSA